MPTLVGSIGSVEGLHKRLHEIGASVADIASMVGGPRPVGDNAKQQEAPASAIAKLAMTINGCHQMAAEIEGAIEAIRRSLGG